MDMYVSERHINEAMSQSGSVWVWKTNHDLMVLHHGYKSVEGKEHVEKLVLKAKKKAMPGYKSDRSMDLYRVLEKMHDSTCTTNKHSSGAIMTGKVETKEAGEAILAAHQKAYGRVSAIPAEEIDDDAKAQLKKEQKEQRAAEKAEKAAKKAAEDAAAAAEGGTVEITVNGEKKLAAMNKEIMLLKKTRATLCRSEVRSDKALCDAFAEYINNITQYAATLETAVLGCDQPKINEAAQEYDNSKLSGGNLISLADDMSMAKTRCKKLESQSTPSK